jgi:steroid 5-alpha reductase family enzyme
MPDSLSLPMAVLGVWIITAVVMVAGWLYQRQVKNATIVDAIWSACMGLSAVAYALVGEGSVVSRALIAVLAGIWAGRLCLHLAHRAFNENEDGRYAYLREHWHGSQWKFFGFFQLQAAVTALFSLPFLAVAQNPAGFSAYTVAAIAVWAVSVGGEALADAQLARYRRDPANKGKTCRAGLWRYSRHPNYFFEWTQWFAYLLLAIGSPVWWLALVGPVVMLLFLYRVSGIPFTEAQAVRHRGDDYRAYQRSTSALIPWPPKKGLDHE